MSRATVCKGHLLFYAPYVVIAETVRLKIVLEDCVPYHQWASEDSFSGPMFVVVKNRIVQDHKRGGLPLA